jgi:hypothetical protein
MKRVLFFISYLWVPFLASKGFAGTISPEESPLSKNDSQDESKKEEKNSDDATIESHVLQDGRKVLRIKNGMNDQQSIVQTDASGEIEEIIKTTSSKSRKMEHQKGTKVISSGYIPRYKRLNHRIDEIQDPEEDGAENQ